jgi:3-oxoacyl-[acyl-carrier-protein] synthase-3
MAQTLSENNLTKEDISVFIPHQANDRITQAIVRRLDLPENVVVSHDIAHTGNTSSASIPLALDALINDNKIKSGDLALIGGFGAGLSYATTIISIP